MGSVIENERTKAKCQIFTPDYIVKTMLDHVGYVESLYGKTVLENSCGNGQFLKEIVKRYISDGKRKGLSRTKIKNGLGRDIFGTELDPLLHQECINNLNSITDSFGLKRVHWQIKRADALREPYLQKFDFIVGNPPYVSYWDLEETERDYIGGKYSACQHGAWDYSYAFLQDGFEHLKSNGRMAYIIPNSIFKTKSGRNIRILLQPYLTEVLDFTTTNVFEKVLTSPAIIIIDRSTKSEKIVYKDLSTGKESTVNCKAFYDEWSFGRQYQASGLQHRFGDYFRVATSIATQCNSIYILTDYFDDGEYLICGGKKIEKSVIRKAASPRGKTQGIMEYIIFPYYYSDGNLKHYDEITFKKKFPFAYAYLESKKEILDKRDADKNSKWFEFGRSQALTYVNQNKLLISTVITGKVHVYPLDREDIPYSGIFVTVRDREDKLSLIEAMDILSSAEFLKYLQSRGINARGKSIRITTKMIADYRW